MMEHIAIEYFTIEVNMQSRADLTMESHLLYGTTADEVVRKASWFSERVRERYHVSIGYPAKLPATKTDIPDTIDEYPFMIAERLNFGVMSPRRETRLNRFDKRIRFEEMYATFRHSLVNAFNDGIETLIWKPALFEYGLVRETTIEWHFAGNRNPSYEHSRDFMKVHCDMFHPESKTIFMHALMDAADVTEADFEAPVIHRVMAVSGNALCRDIPIVDRSGKSYAFTLTGANEDSVDAKIKYIAETQPDFKPIGITRGELTQSHQRIHMKCKRCEDWNDLRNLIAWLNICDETNIFKS